MCPARAPALAGLRRKKRSNLMQHTVTVWHQQLKFRHASASTIQDRHFIPQNQEKEERASREPIILI